MKCRSECGACCIAASLVEPYYGMPQGKPAGVACAHLHPQTMRCGIWDSEHYPTACKNFAADKDFCGDSKEEAIKILTIIENDTHPHISN